MSIVIQTCIHQCFWFKSIAQFCNPQTIKRTLVNYVLPKFFSFSNKIGTKVFSIKYKRSSFFINLLFYSRFRPQNNNCYKFIFSNSGHPWKLSRVLAVQIQPKKSWERKQASWRKFMEIALFAHKTKHCFGSVKCWKRKVVVLWRHQQNSPQRWDKHGLVFSSWLVALFAMEENRFAIRNVITAVVLTEDDNVGCWGVST